MKKQKNNTGAAVSLTPKINSRRVISTILAVIFMVSMLTVTCFATGTGGTGGGDHVQRLRGSGNRLDLT